MNQCQSFIESVAVTKSDSTPVNCKAIYVGGTGNLVIKHSETSATVTYSSVPAGAVLYLNLRNGRIMNATTATDIIAMS